MPYCRVTLQSTDRNLESFWPTIAGGSAAGGQHGRGGNLSLTRKSKHGAKMEHRSRPRPDQSAFFRSLRSLYLPAEVAFQKRFRILAGDGSRTKAD